MQDIIPFLSNHWILATALMLILVFIFINEAQAKQAEGKKISPQTAIDKMNHEEAVVIDIREAALFSKGHIINAIRANESDFTDGKMDKYKNTPIILVCTRGIQTASLSNILKAKNFMHPFVLDGGITAWIEAGLPVVKGK
jgi:rhodanese-related sulfurtransferase